MNKNFTNKDIAELLRSVAAAYTVKDENKYKFQIIAYQRAADSVEHASSEIKDLWDEKKLGEIAGIGSSIASHLDELFKNGKVKHFTQVFSGLPAAMFSLLKIPGVGPKTAYKLTKILKIKDPSKAVSDLEKSAKLGKIRTIEGFGEESEAKILKSIQELSGRTERILLYQAEEIADKVIDYLKNCPLVIRADPLGSLRRKCSTVGDIDISVASDKPKEVINYFTKYPHKKRILEAGEATASILLITNHQVDLMIQPSSAYGALLQHFTGSKHHNIKLREVALKKGFSLSEYGIRKIRRSEKLEVGSEKEERPKGKLIEFSSEEKFYNFLGMEFIPPELREDGGEIEAAIKQDQSKLIKLPRLVNLKDVKGDLHLHSNFPIEPSHDLGESPVEEMVKRAFELGYEYLAFTEHSPSTSRHTESQIINLLRRKKEFFEQIISSRARKLPIKIFNSLEIDIKPNGELSIPKEGLKYLDFAIVSVHTSFKMDRKSMTERILKGLDHPKVKILGHPTGRKLNEREGYELEWEKVFEFCRKNNKFLEISAWPERLDLPDFLVKEAVKNEVKMIISTDSHSVEQMNLMKYGVYVARRGWAEKKNILNTLAVNEISDILLKC